MNRRTSGASLLYAETSPARWFRTAAMIVDAWGSSLCALQWHASRAAHDRSAKAQPVIGAPLLGPPVAGAMGAVGAMGAMGQRVMGLMGQRAPARVRRDRE